MFHYLKTKNLIFATKSFNFSAQSSNLHPQSSKKVINHHRDVPYRVLQHKYGFTQTQQSKTPTNAANKIIHGDNLEALKSLLPEIHVQND